LAHIQGFGTLSAGAGQMASVTVHSPWLTSRGYHDAFSRST
jgi:hypothetical protein